MKKLLAILAVLLVATIALAGSYTITTNTAQDTRLERQRIRLNKTTCQSYGLSSDCTQAQCRAKAPGCDIYSDVADLISRLIVKPYTDGLKNTDTSDDQAQFCTWFTAATNAQKNSACALAGLPNGCELCQ